MSQADVIIMRPLGIGQVLDRAVRLYRQNFLSFVGIVAVAQIPTSIALLFLSSLLSTPESTLEFLERPSTFLGGGVLTTLISLVLTQLANAAITRAIANQYLGKPTGIVAAYRELGSRWLSLVGALIIAMLVAILLLIFALIVPCLGWFTGFGMFFYFVSVIIPLLASVIVLEEHSAVSAWRRIWDLVRQRFWWTFLFALVLQLFAQLFVTAPVTILQLVLGSFAAGNETLTSIVIPQLVQLVGNLIYLPLSLTAITLFYFDLRVRNEGLDMALMLESAAGEEVTVAEVLGSGARSNPSLVNTSELTGFFAIELGFVAIYIVLIGVVVLLSLATF